MEHGFINQCDVIMWFHSCKCSVREDICVCDLFSQFVLVVKAIYATLQSGTSFASFSAVPFALSRNGSSGLKIAMDAAPSRGTLYSKGCSCTACPRTTIFFTLYINTVLFSDCGTNPIPSVICPTSFSILIYDGVYSADDLLLPVKARLHTELLCSCKAWLHCSLSF